ncbi:alpha/beta fold hydrolase [Spongiibacter sp.]|uniref:alpha/beta fold hydrolase n=1 Tax=Spongiibacter sp. TaxID=2024860 RepID=UPI0035678549
MTNTPPPIKHWLFLRGLARESGHWETFINDCQRQLGWQCHSLDLPGFGRAYQQRSPLSIPDIRNALQARLQLPADQPLGIVALSLGAMVALDWLRAEPSRIHHVILINSSSADCLPWQRLQLAVLPQLLRALCARSIADQEQAILRLVSNTQPVTLALLNQHCELRRRHPALRRNVLRQLWAAARFRAPAALAPHQQLLLVASRADRMVSWRCSVKLAQRYQCALRLHNSAGHDLPIDDGDWLIQQFPRYCP